jgi:hypothetical protein
VHTVDQVYGRRLGPSLVTFHVQLAWRNWLVVQLNANETVCLDPPDFTQGLNMLEIQNNLMWLPTVTNIPALSALRSPARQPAAATPFRTPIQVPPPPPVVKPRKPLHLLAAIQAVKFAIQLDKHALSGTRR